MVFLKLILFLFFQSQARASCDASELYCADSYGSHQGSSPAYPSKNSSISLNPSGVPLEKGLGLEMIAYGSGADFSIIRGTGRIGAALSPSNNEQTFFGPPAFELDLDYLNRMLLKNKYTSQKYTLATAFSLWSNQQSGISRAQLNLGAIAKYNRLTKNTLPGAGLSTILGPLSLGYSYSQDEDQLSAPGAQPPTSTIRSWTETYMAGLSLSNLALDYSRLQLHQRDVDHPILISQFVVSLIVQRFILTAAQRLEDSERPAFDFSKQILVPQQLKTENFGGLQFSTGPHLLVGAFYNYYLLREISIGLTLFF